MMTVIKLKGCRYGAQKVSLTRLFKEHTELSLLEAKQTTSRLVAGELVELSFLDGSSAEAFKREAIALGALVVD